MEEPTLKTDSLLTKDTCFLDFLNSDSLTIEKLTQNFTKTSTDIERHMSQPICYHIGLNST